MDFETAKKQFEINHYKWSIKEFDDEISNSFRTMKLAKCGSPWQTYQFMKGLSRPEMALAATGFVKWFHANAIRALGDDLSAEERAMRARRDAFPNNVLVFEKEIRKRIQENPAIKIATKRGLRQAVEQAFREAFGDRCRQWPSIAEDSKLAFRMECCGWVVNTFFFFGNKDAVLNYKHNVVSERLYERGEGKLPMILGSLISFNSSLGINSQTEWKFILEDEIRIYCSAAAGLCGRFFDSLPVLLDGLDCGNVTPI